MGPEVGREPGWPKWYGATQGKDATKVHEASRYYDVVNFAPRIKCPVLVGFGVVDEVCPPEGVMAAVNQITAPKEVLLGASWADTRKSAARIRRTTTDDTVRGCRHCAAGNPAPVK